MASLHRRASWLIAAVKEQKKEGTYFPSNSFFLAAFHAYRQNHKAASDEVIVRKKKQRHNQITHIFFFANNRNNRIGTAKNMAEDMGWRTPSRKYTTQTARRLQMLYSLVAETGKSTNSFPAQTVERRKSTSTVHNSCSCVTNKKNQREFLIQPFISRHHWWHLTFLLPFSIFAGLCSEPKKMNEWKPTPLL